MYPRFNEASLDESDSQDDGEQDESDGGRFAKLELLKSQSVQVENQNFCAIQRATIWRHDMDQGKDLE